MNKYQESQVWGFIFQYLKYEDLRNAAFVCRFWEMVAKKEKTLRGPICVIKTGVQINSQISSSCVKTDMVKNYKGRPGLHIFFTNDKCQKLQAEECHCKILTVSSYSVNLEKTLPEGNVEKENTFISFYFPKTSKTKIATYTFLKDKVKAGLFCQEIRFHCGSNISKVMFLKSEFRSFFRNESFTKSSVIMFCQNNSYPDFADFIITLSEWFPQSMIDIWGGMTDSFTLCQSCFNEHFCNIDVEFAAIFISNPTMRVYNEFLDDNCNTAEKIKASFKNLKEKIKFRLHSVALMHFSVPRIKKYYSLDIFIFKEFFPNVTLFPIYSAAAFRANGLEDLVKKMLTQELRNNEMTTNITILTYN